MIFGMINKIKKYNIITFSFLFFLFATPVYSLELTELLQRFSKQEKSTADFIEEQQAFYLEEPLTSSGYLQFVAPDKLYKFILKPENISQKIEGDVLQVSSKSGTTTFVVDEYPEFSVVLNALVSFLSGDYIHLKNDFKIKFESMPQSWELLLLPRDSYIAAHVESIMLSGKGDNLNKIIITQPNKDSTITRIFNHR